MTENNLKRLSGDMWGSSPKNAGGGKTARRKALKSLLGRTLKSPFRKERT